jgi:cytochrome c553
MKLNPLSVALSVALLAMINGAASAQTAGNAAAGHEKTQMCAGCHGIPGWRNAFPEVYSVPMIAGQHPQYIVRALQAYRSGERQHQTMRAIASSLSDADMANLAAYYGAAPEAVAKK